MSLLRKIQSRSSWKMPDVRRTSNLTLEMGLGGQLRMAQELNDQYVAPTRYKRGRWSETAVRSRPGRASRAQDPHRTVPVNKNMAMEKAMGGRSSLQRIFSTQ